MKFYLLFLPKNSRIRAKKSKEQSENLNLLYRSTVHIREIEFCGGFFFFTFFSPSLSPSALISTLYTR